MNRDHSVVFEISSKYCISDSFVDHDGYSISKLFIIIISEFYKTFNTNTFEVDITVLVILKFIDMETEI